MKLTPPQDIIVSGTAGSFKGKPCKTVLWGFVYKLGMFQSDNISVV